MARYPTNPRNNASERFTLTMPVHGLNGRAERLAYYPALSGIRPRNGQYRPPFLIFSAL
jgi:hypothetical protein